MGVWGTRLYSGDFALDLRTTVGAVARLPYDGEKLATILAENNSATANNPDDPDHTTFWLILADQFAKRGISCDRVRTKALEIIDSDLDIHSLAKLGMSSPDQAKRRKTLAELRFLLLNPPKNLHPRKTMQRPQPLILEIGDLFLYPTFEGKNLNPYYASKELDNKHWSKNGPVAWKQDGWSAMLIVDRGRAFDFLPWYTPLTLSAAVAEKPTLENLLAPGTLWKLRGPGTLTPLHLKRLELEKLATISLDPEKLGRALPDLRPGIFAAVSDISISNAMSVSTLASGRPSRLISIPQIAALP